MITFTLKPIAECLEFRSDLFFIPEREFYRNYGKPLQAELIKSYNCLYVKIDRYEYPVQFLNLPFMYLINNQGKLRGC